MGTHWSRNNRESSVSFKSDGSKYYKYLKKKQSFFRVRGQHSAGVCYSSEQQQRPDSAELSVNMGTHWSDMSMRSVESSDSGVSLEFDQSEDKLRDLKESSVTGWVNSSSSEEEHAVADDEDLVESSDNLVSENLLSYNSSCLSVEKDDSDDRTPDIKETPLSPKKKMTERSMESIDSGVSLKSDQSKEKPIYFKDSSSLRSDLSSFEEDHPVAHDEDLIKSLDNLDEMIQELSSEVGWKHCRGTC